MLYLIGLGLWDERDISLKALEILKTCDEIFLETYTSVWNGDLRKLNLKFKKIERVDLEENINKILTIAKEKNVAVLVPGDPLIATTHNSILEEAMKMKIKFEIIHNASILTAISETGLQIYKFGKITSISWYYSEYPYDILKQNKKIKAHTLFLLDTNPKPMSPKEGLKRLLDIEKKRKESLINKESFCIIACRLGSKNREILFGKIKEMLDINFVPAVIIIPSDLHFSEKEFLSSLKNLKI